MIRNWTLAVSPHSVDPDPWLLANSLSNSNSKRLTFWGGTRWSSGCRVCPSSSAREPSGFSVVSRAKEVGMDLTHQKLVISPTSYAHWEYWEFIWFQHQKLRILNQFTWVCATKNETYWDRWAGHLEISWVENHPIPLFVGHEQGQMVRIVGSSSEAWCSGGIRSFARAWKWWHVHRAPGNGSGWQWWGRSRAFGKAIPCRHL